MQYNPDDLIKTLIYILEKNKEYICEYFNPKEDIIEKYNKWIDMLKCSETLDWDQLKKFILSLNAFSGKSVASVRLRYKDIVFELIDFMKNINLSELKESSELENVVSNITKDLKSESFEEMKASLQKSLTNLKKVLSAKEKSRSHIKQLTDKIDTISKDLKKSQKQLKKDLFTDLNNKDSFNKELKIIVSVFHNKKSASLNHLLVLLDIDDFKGINDKYGHQKGDAAILSLSKLLKTASLQTGGFAARFGGDEFAFVCEIKSLESATTFLKNLMQKIRQLKINDNEFHLTCSIGAALLKNGEDDHEWLGHTDKALYHAKSKGKNTFVLFIHK